ncbi:hypothetical protein E1258_11025 [Micromonospora sp. KC207]|uniref:hypothetical protein n=1 Tax=Micromonospora sp. KC207 TaxID=2530377 RepID=UPI00104501A2|nr:hypothetical protein [Micromonospora sp. KC207]TDC61604.1 hypothetical protein E1258_11025 [Micromonospora sp. KC207]
MSAERGVIDLGERSRQPAAHTPDRLVGGPKLGVRLVAAFAVGAVLGGVGVSELRNSRKERERIASVSLVALPASGGGGGGMVAEGVLLMGGQLVVINAGPAPVTVRAATGQRPGVVVRDIGQSRLLRPGGTGWIAVELRLECSIAFGSEPLSIRLSVETADRQMREVSYPVALMGSDWHRSAEPACEHVR